jgi:PTS system nitrogen regulatory IIA component
MRDGSEHVEHQLAGGCGGINLLFLTPEHAGADHLKALARISRLLRDHDVVAKLRGTDTAEGLYAILTEPVATPHAA